MNLDEALELHKAGKLEEAKCLYQALLLTEDNPDIIYFLGLLEMQSGQYQQAIDALLTALERQPNASKIHVALGKAFVQIGELAVAEEHFFTATEIDPSANHLFLLGTVQYQLEDKESAQRCWTMALQCDPNHFEALLFLGSLQDENNQEEEALRLWSIAFEVNPDSLQIRDVLSRWYSRAAEKHFDTDPKQSLSLINTALEYSSNAKLLHQKSEILLQLQQMEAALTHCESALELEQEAVFYHTLGNIYRLSNQPQRALQSYRQAKEMGLEHPATNQAIEQLQNILDQ